MSEDHMITPYPNSVRQHLSWKHTHTHKLSSGSEFTFHGDNVLLFLLISIQPVSNMYTGVFNTPAVSADAIKKEEKFKSTPDAQMVCAYLYN